MKPTQCPIELPDVQVSDTTDDDSSNAADKIKKIDLVTEIYFFCQSNRFFIFLSLK